jgi:hypothetical protein
MNHDDDARAWVASVTVVVLSKTPAERADGVRTVDSTMRITNLFAGIILYLEFSRSDGHVPNIYYTQATLPGVVGIGSRIQKIHL